VGEKKEIGCRQKKNLTRGKRVVMFQEQSGVKGKKTPKTEEGRDLKGRERDSYA